MQESWVRRSQAQECQVRRRVKAREPYVPLAYVLGLVLTLVPFSVVRLVRAQRAVVFVEVEAHAALSADREQLCLSALECSDTLLDALEARLTLTANIDRSSLHGRRIGVGVSETCGRSGLDDAWQRKNQE